MSAVLIDASDGSDAKVTMAEMPDPFALITASQAASYAGVSVQAIVNWRKRDHLQPAAYDHGRPLYRLLDVAKAEHRTRKRARR